MRQRIKNYLKNNLKYYVAIILMFIAYQVTGTIKAGFVVMVLSAVVFAIADIVTFIRSNK